MSLSSSSLLQEAREKAASIINAILQSFIVFISFLYLYVYVSVNINAVKRETLHHRALNVLNRLFFEVGQPLGGRQIDVATIFQFVSDEIHQSRLTRILAARCADVLYAADVLGT